MSERKFSDKELELAQSALLKMVGNSSNGLDLDSCASLLTKYSKSLEIKTQDKPLTEGEFSILHRIFKKERNSLPPEVLESSRVYLKSQHKLLLDKNQALSRRRFFLLGGVAALSLLGGEVIYKSQELSPGARNSALEKQKIWEQNHTLGLKPTYYSSRGWRVFYPSTDSSVKYVPSSEKPYYLTIGDTPSFIQFKSDNIINDAYNLFVNNAMGTGISLQQYNKTDGVIVPELVINEKEGVVNPVILLRDKSTKNIDSNVVVFEQKDDQSRVYVHISKADTADQETYKFTFMNKVNLK